MKGDGNIKRTINFLGVGNNKLCQANVKLYCKGKKIFEGRTCNGKISIELPPNQGFRLLATYCGMVINTSIYTNTCKYTFSFNQISTNTVIFSLRDEYYNIPIERGQIILWQR